MTIEEMKKRKRELGFSNQTLAGLSGVPVGTLQKVFSGKTEAPREETIRKLQNVLEKREGNPFAPASDTAVVREAEPSYAAEVPSWETGTDHTIEDYLALPEDERYELIDGRFYKMETPPVAHQRILRFLSFEIEWFIRKNDGKCEVLPAPVDVKIIPEDNKTMVQPDIVVICEPDKVQEKRIEGAPDFIVEITSSSTRRKDITIKMSKYSEAGVREYWIIDVQKKVLIRYRFEEDLIPEIIPLAGELAVGIYEGRLKISLDEIAKLIP